MPQETGVKRVYLLDYGVLAGEPGWFIPNPLLYVEMGDVRRIAEKHKWVEIPVTGALVSIGMAMFYLIQEATLRPLRSGLKLHGRSSPWLNSPTRIGLRTSLN